MPERPYPDDNKLTCPACGSCTSNALYAYEADQPCPHCDLPAASAEAVFKARAAHADEHLIAQAVAAETRALAAEREAAELRERLRRIRDATID